MCARKETEAWSESSVQIIERGLDCWLVRVLLGHDPAIGRKRKCGAQV